MTLLGFTPETYGDVLYVRTINPTRHSRNLGADSKKKKKKLHYETTYFR